MDLSIPENSFLRKIPGCLLSILIFFVIIYILIFLIRLLVIGSFHNIIRKVDIVGIGVPTWTMKGYYNFCTYRLPKNFKFGIYGEGTSRVKEIYKKQALVIFYHDYSKQIISINRFYQHLTIDPKKIQVNKRELSKTKNNITMEISNDFMTKQYMTGTLTDTKTGKVLEKYKVLMNPNPQKFQHFYNLCFYVPYFYTAQFKEGNNSLIMRGFDQTDFEKISTDKTNVYIYYGFFEKLALDKEKDYIRRYYITVLDFLEKKKGAVAIVQNKETKETLFCITASPLGEVWDKEEFRRFLKTITFKTHVYAPLAKPQLLSNKELMYEE